MCRLFGFRSVLRSQVHRSLRSADNALAVQSRVHPDGWGVAYYVAGAVAILLGLCPKFGAIVSATPGGVLGGITVVLYGMIGLIGAKIWVENRVDFGNPVNLVGLAAGIIAGIGGVTLKFTDDFSLSGIALGTILVIVFYHLVDRGRGHGNHREPDEVTKAL